MQRGLERICEPFDRHTSRMRAVRAGRAGRRKRLLPKHVESTSCSSGGEPSQRMLRVAELIRHTVSDLLTRGAINDPVLEGHVVTVPDVRMSPDLKLATVYVMPLGGKDVTRSSPRSNATGNSCAAEIAHHVNLKFAPDVRFKADQSFDCGAQDRCSCSSRPRSSAISKSRSDRGLNERAALQSHRGQRLGRSRQARRHDLDPCRRRG